MELLLSLALFTLLGAVTLAIVRHNNLVGVVILAAIYSFLMASVMILLDAVDVALTEASVGAGISTVLLLAALSQVKALEYAPKGPKVGAALLTLVVGGGVIWGATALPPFGVAEAPIHQHVAPRFIAEAENETGVPNMVTAVLADYRAFDTLGETSVVFVAALAVLALLRARRPVKSEEHPEPPSMTSDLALRVGSKLILPFIMLFAFYVQLHGDFGPGGGFQAGVIAAAGVILVSITLGLRRAKRIAPRRVVEAMAALGVLIFAGTGIVTMALGGNFLDYAVLAHDPKHGHHIGILMVEAGVLVTVAGAMITLFYAFVERGR